jgi:RIO kinase 1
MSYRDYEPVDLARVGLFSIHQLESLEKDNIENAFAGYVTEVLGKINDGKEASVYLCSGGDDARDQLFAAKVFKARHFRNFNSDRSYRNFSKMRDKRMAKSMRGKSSKGEKAFHQHWVNSEWRMLNLLHDAGVRVPEPYAEFPDGVLMEFIGDTKGPAPRLINCKFSTVDLEDIGTKLIRDISLMLEIGIVHGDLSPYNILFNGDEPVIIDVPQAMDLRTTPDGFSIMHRDLMNLDRYFRKLGVTMPFLELLDNI